MYSDSSKLWNLVTFAQEMTKNTEKTRDTEFRILGRYTKYYTEAKENLTVAQKSLKDSERLRYRYLME